MGQKTIGTPMGAPREVSGDLGMQRPEVNSPCSLPGTPYELVALSEYHRLSQAMQSQLYPLHLRRDPIPLTQPWLECSPILRQVLREFVQPCSLLALTAPSENWLKNKARGNNGCRGSWL
jgi:hypothetical protein